MSSTVACPVCDGSTAPYCTKSGAGREWRFRRCTACGYGYVEDRPNPREAIEANASVSGGQIATPSEAKLQLRHEAAQQAKIVATLTNRREGTLDVGCGDGAFTYHLHRAGFTGPHYMLDLNPHQAASAALIPDSRFSSESFEDFPRIGGLSCIVLSQVLEHVYDPMAWLRRCRDELADGGVIAVSLPNFAGVYRVLGARDPMLHPPMHLNHFTPRSLRLAMQAAGLRMLRMDSSSRVRHGRRPLLRPVTHAWNALIAPLLAFTTRGISLRAFATPALPSTVPSH